MATQADVRRIALSLVEVTESDDFRFARNGKDFLWLWRERVDPKKARVPNAHVLVARVADEQAKQMLLAMDRDVFFTEPHYDGYNAVLVRLPKISRTLLKRVVTEAWETRVTTPPRSRATRARPTRRARR